MKNDLTTVILFLQFRGEFVQPEIIRSVVIRKGVITFAITLLLDAMHIAAQLIRLSSEHLTLQRWNFLLPTS